MVLLIIGLIHFYLWKRLVRDPLRPGRGRRIGTALAVLLCALAPVTLIGVRAGYVKWLSWPGYLWIAVMFYLLVTLAVLEVPRALALRLWAGPGRTAAKARTGTAGTASSGQGESGQGETVPASAAIPIADAATGPVGGAATGAQAGTTAPVVTDVPPTVPPSVAGEGPAGEPEPTPEEKRGIERRLLLARGSAIFAGLTAAGVTGYGVKTATSAPRIDRFQMPMAKLPRAMDGTRLAVVSDIHIGPLTGANHAQRIVQVINSVNADLVCIVGDLVDGSVAELGRFAAPLGGIESRHGAFFVTGNHEYYSGHEEWIAEVDRLGIRPLRNERVPINGLDLAGVNDLAGEQQGDAPDFGRALGDRDTSRPVVLMAHQPVAAKEAAAFGVDLQVSGHTHGGQMAPFNLLVKLQQPVVSGFGKVDGVPVYVTNGAGFWGPPVRVGAPPQVTVIELRAT
ncbi:metallophosphoesterase [Actinoplanes sandaracinus]|uniref:metallophosphoesterase n=1 Tax=Actinoplanes sandaracinus TaxID=3045177 RepID=UPI0038991D50